MRGTKPELVDSTRLLPLAALSAVAVVYFATAARHLLGGDNGELATLYAVGGVAHPPGYPLYVLWLRLFRWLPAASPAHGAALATALLGVAAAVSLYSACRAWGASRQASTVVVVTYAFASLPWRLATHAEVFTLNALLAGMILVVAAPGGPLGGARRTAALALLAGLGLSNHHSIVLLAPVGVCGAVAGIRESKRPLRTVVAGIVALTVGLLPYAYVLARARRPFDGWVWGDASSVRGLLFHFRRGEYGTTSLAISRAERAPVAHAIALLVHVVRDLIGLPLVAIVTWGTTKLAQITRRTYQAPGAGPERRGGLVALAGSLLLCGPVFVALFNLPLDGLAGRVVERFYLLPETACCIFVAGGLDALRTWLPPRRLGAALVTVAAGAGTACLSLPALRRHQDPAVELYVFNVLKVAPPRAFVLGTGDHRLGAFAYAKLALGVRTDVVYVDPMMLHNPWYHRRASHEAGFDLVRPRDGSLSTPMLAAQLLATGRPLLVADVFSNRILEAFPTYPVGPLLRVLPAGAPLPSPESLYDLNARAFEQLELDATPPERSSWGGDLQKDYARPWIALSGTFAMSGDQQRAEECRARARTLAPWTVP